MYATLTILSLFIGISADETGSVCCYVFQRFEVCCSVLQCVAVCCSELPCVAVCCSVWQGIALYVAVCS